MRDINQYAKICMKQLDRLDIHYADNIEFKVNTRAVTRLGVCKKNGNQYLIEISSALLDERTPLQNGLMDTLMHELLHTCRGCMKHTGRWKQLADKVNQTYGYHIKRAASKNENIIPAELTIQPKYHVVCRSCGAVYERYRMSSLIKHPERYRCGKCKGASLINN